MKAKPRTSLVCAVGLFPPGTGANTNTHPAMTDEPRCPNRITNAQLIEQRLNTGVQRFAGTFARRSLRVDQPDACSRRGATDCGGATRRTRADDQNIKRGQVELSSTPRRVRG